MNSGILIQSILIGYSFVCISPLIKKLQVRNKIIVYGTSFSFFWGFVAIVFILCLMIDTYFSINIFQSIVIIFIILVCSLFLNRSSKVWFSLEDFIVFTLTFSTTYITSYFQLPRMRGGDGYWLAQIAVSLSDGVLESGDFSGAGHRAPLWIILESFSLMISNYFFIQFQHLSALVTLLILISIIYDKKNTKYENFIFSFLLLCLISAPAYIALSIYFEIHSFGSLLIILLWYYSQIYSYKKSQHLLISIVIVLLCCTLSLARFEGFLLALPFLYKFYLIDKKILNLKIYLILFSINALWYFNLINLGIVHKSSSDHIFFVIAIIPFVSVVFFQLIEKYLSLKNLLNIQLITVFLLLIISSQFREIIFTFFNILNFYGGWGSTGPLFLIFIAYLTYRFLVKNFRKGNLFTENISIMIVFGLQLLTFFGNTALGWRYGLTSSANRLFYMIVPILILDFYREFKSDQNTV